MQTNKDCQSNESANTELDSRQINNIFLGKDPLIQTNVISHLILYALHYTTKMYTLTFYIYADIVYRDSTDEKATRQTQMEAVKVLGYSWWYFDECI
jgi:hypothetical protein